jgi:hypothetical protein
VSTVLEILGVMRKVFDSIWDGEEEFQMKKNFSILNYC